jgi:hypothetical protein
MALLKPNFLMKHPIRSGLIWTALFLTGVILWNLVMIDKPPENLSGLIVMAVLVGIGWGYSMRWWHKRKLGSSY